MARSAPLCDPHVSALPRGAVAGTKQSDGTQSPEPQELYSQRQRPKSQAAGPNPCSIRRIVKQVASGNGTRNRAADEVAAVVHAVLANAVQQPAGALRAIK